MIDNDAVLALHTPWCHFPWPRRTGSAKRPNRMLASLYTGLLGPIANHTLSTRCSWHLKNRPALHLPAGPPPSCLLALPRRVEAHYYRLDSTRTLPEPDKLLQQRSLPHIAIVVVLVVVRVPLAVVIIMAVASLPRVARVVAVRGVIHSTVLVLMLPGVAIVVFVALVVVRVPLRVVDVLRLVLMLDGCVAVLAARL